MQCHHNLETDLHEYIDGAGLANDPKSILFQTYIRSVLLCQTISEGVNGHRDGLQIATALGNGAESLHPPKLKRPGKYRISLAP